MEEGDWEMWGRGPVVDVQGQSRMGVLCADCV
jgi:hypothetical protein